jgi:hypothetical protein
VAGEIRGKIYELLTKVALEIAIDGNRKRWQVLWHEQPEWVSIEADLAVGEDKNSITALLLVTHSRSEKLSEKKFWRNFGEFFQWKVQGPYAVRVFSVLFDSTIKPALRVIDDVVIDASLDLSVVDYGKKLIRYVTKKQDFFGKTDNQREATVRALIDSTSERFDPTFASWVSAFTDDLKTLLKQSAKGKTDKAWMLLRAIDTRKVAVPPAKNTYVRNGLAKLMLADVSARQYLYHSLTSGKPVPYGVLPKYTLDLGLVTEDIEGCWIKDPEIQSAVRMLGPKDSEAVISMAPSRMRDFIDPLRSIANIGVYSQFVLDHFRELKTAAGMKKWLQACFDDPVGMIGKIKDFDVPPRDNWLFVYCITLEKAAQKRIVAYGLSNLAAETGFPEIGQGGFVIPPFVHRQKPLPDAMLSAVARVFAKKIDTLGAVTLGSDDFRRTMQEMLVQRQMYILSTYRNFDPLACLILLELKTGGVSGQIVTIPSFLKELAGVSSATSVFIAAGTDTLISWQSCHGSHVNDKTKELSARFRATKVSWNGKEFVGRMAAKRIFFVADGEWRDEDLAMLGRSGVDRFFYSDQIGNLVIAIKAAH